MLASVKRSISNEYHSAFNGYAALGATIVLFTSIDAFTNTSPEFLVSYMVDCGHDEDLLTKMCVVSEHGADVLAVTAIMYVVAFPVIAAMSMLIQDRSCSPCKRSVDVGDMHDPLAGPLDANAPEREELLKTERALENQISRESKGQDVSEGGYVAVSDDLESGQKYNKIWLTKAQQDLTEVRARLSVIGRVPTTTHLDSLGGSFVVPKDSVHVTIFKNFQNVGSTLWGMLRLENPIHASAAITVVAACLLSKDIQSKFGLDNAGGAALVDVCLGMAAIASLLATRKLFVRPPLRFMTNCLSEKAASWIVQSSKEEARGVRDMRGEAYLSGDVNLGEDSETNQPRRWGCC